MKSKNKLHYSVAKQMRRQSCLMKSYSNTHNSKYSVITFAGTFYIKTDKNT